MSRPRIDKTGIYRINMETYHGDCCAGPSVSSSGLRTIFNESPAHYFVNSYLNPKRGDQADSEAFVLGRAAHHLLLGEDAFSTLFSMRPEKFDSWRTEASKTWKAEQENQGRTVLLPSQIEQIRGMARSLAAHPLVQAGILNGDIERSLIYQDETTGVWCKSRPDAIPNDSGDFADLKTTISVGDEDLRRTIGDNSYHMQAALVATAWKAVSGKDLTSFSLVFVEKKAPFCSRVVTLKTDDIARGIRQNAHALKVFANCIKTGEWPGPGRADAEYLDLPAWVQSRIDAQLQFLEKA